MSAAPYWVRGSCASGSVAVVAVPLAVLLPLLRELELRGVDAAVVQLQHELAAAAGPLLLRLPDHHVLVGAAEVREHRLLLRRPRDHVDVSAAAARRAWVAVGLRLRPAEAAEREADRHRHAGLPLVYLRWVLHRPEEAVEAVGHAVRHDPGRGVAGVVRGPDLEGVLAEARRVDRRAVRDRSRAARDAGAARLVLARVGGEHPVAERVD